MNPLWQFSLEYYRRPGVEEECLIWQERFGADVNVVLMCLWCATLGRLLDGEALRGLKAETSVGRWRRDVIGPIRVARRSSRSFSKDADPEATGEVHGEMRGGALYQSLLDVELKAERIEQDMLWCWVLDLPPVAPERHRWALRRLAQANLRAYAECLAVTEPDGSNVDVLLDALETGA